MRYALAVWLSLGMVGVAAAADPPTVSSITEVEGQPKGHDKKIRRPRYFLWHDEAGWHLHTKTGGGKHDFKGVIRVAGGKFYDVTGGGGFEPKKDGALLNGVENTLEFSFKTQAPGDGLDFKVSGASTRLEFDLKIDGYGHPMQIDVGEKSTHPETAQFTVPLKPQIK